MRRKLIYTGILLLIAGGIRAGDPPAAAVPTPAFNDGEKLTFVAGYSSRIVSADAGEVVLRTTKTTLNDRPVWRVYGNATTYTFFRWFYELNDTYNTWMDERTFLPLEFTGDVREGKYRFKSHFRYDWDSMVVNTTFRNLAREKDNHRRMPLTYRSFDALALFYNMRNMEISDFKPNEPRILELVLEDTIRKVSYRYMGTETKKIKGLGTFETFKFSCQLATSSGESFEDGSEFFIWISNDRNKIPLYVETPLRIGSGRIRLTKFENLRYPLSSKIR